MTLTVETGEGLSNADAFVSLGEFQAACESYGRDDSPYSEEEVEQAIRRATDFLSNSFSWQAFRTHGRDQALAWPRSGAVDYEGYGIDSDEIPPEIVKACVELAWQELQDPYSLNPVHTEATTVKSETVGAISVEYALSDTSPDAQRPILLAVRDLVSQFLSKGSGNMLAGSSFRV